MSLETTLKKILSDAFTAVAASATDDDSSVEPVDPQLHASKHADFQADAAMRLAKILRSKPRDIAQSVADGLQGNALLEQVEVAGPGFLNITLSNRAVDQALAELAVDERLGVEQPESGTIIVDYSSPNVAKEMHVGHLRSTIIGDACVRLLEWQGHTVIRRNHIGDWGTPFGMLIEHLLDLGEANATDALSVGDLNTFYRGARDKFEADSVFQDRARTRVVKFQGGDQETLRLWKILIEQSQRYFVDVYGLMDVRLDGTEFYGESKYNDALEDTITELKGKNLIVDSDGAECLFPEGFTNRDGDPLPLIARKSDGGFGYATTDLAAIRQRTGELHADRILYVVGAPQNQHLEMIFAAARSAGWLTPPASAEHIAFGSVLGSDGKMFKSRSGETVKLASLLEEAVRRARDKVREKNPDLDADELEAIAQATGIGAIKYADLSSERTRDYVFDYDRMLAAEGNTAPYLQYAHARIKSMLRKAGATAAPGEIRIAEPSERQLALLLARFPDVIANVEKTLLFHQLAQYLFDVATAFSSFYANCQVLLPDDQETTASRLALSQLVARTLTTGLGFLGIRTPERM
ncbi:MAG: arginine--tRNA ligase [Gammaproteobacteria bacterium]|nr:arginine--tRNA ligase [Gammaproteobacteria bacterium]